MYPRRLAFLLTFFLFVVPAFASKGISVAGLEQRLAAEHGKPDAEVAQRLSELELTERASTAILARFLITSPGPKTSQELKILANSSAFLPPPNAEIAALPVPDLAAQRKMMALVVNYVGKTIHQLPNFTATRTTTHFEETLQARTAFTVIGYRPLHETDAFQATVLYRNGQEVVDAGKVGSKGIVRNSGLSDWGVFGPILSTVLLDAAKSDLSWSHWEQIPQHTRAVFRYAVPLEHSHYRATYCCVSGADPLSSPKAPFDRIVGYHGEMTVDPQDGSILRVTVEADLKPSDPISRADIMVEYSPVEIGDRTYVCATRSVALSTALSASSFHSQLGASGGLDAVQPTPGQPQKLMNDVTFSQYRIFRSEAHMLTPDEATAQGVTSTASPASELPSEVTQGIPAPQPADSGGSPSAQDNEEAPALAAKARESLEASVISSTARAPAPEAPDAPMAQIPIFKTTSREVLVDVVATKKNGESDLGLVKQDFEVRENGRPQSITFFQARTKADVAPAPLPEMPQMPDGTRTNVAAVAPSGSVNLLLIDALNTETQDQALVRRKVTEFLGKMRPGTRIAIFMLGAKLRCLQGFTSDSSALVAALNSSIQKNTLLQTRDDQASNAELVATLETMQTSPSAIEALRGALAEEGGRDAGARAQMTFEALMYLGHYLSGVPGRKNLIWFAGSFPVALFPTAEQLSRMKQNPHLQGSVDLVKAAANLYTVSQIAVYPISAEGLTGDHIGEADAAGTGTGGGVGHLGSQTDSTMAPYSAAAESRGNTFAAMANLAASTGGKAYYNGNDLNAALQHAIDDGASYYTLGYRSDDRTMDGSYRRIEIRLLHGKDKLTYRQGYNAEMDATPVSQSGVDPLVPLLQPGLPDATGILYGARAELAAVQPEPGQARAGQNRALTGSVRRYRVEFMVRGQDLVFRSTPGNVQRGRVLFGVKAYDHLGNAVNWTADEETMDIGPDQFAAVRKGGVTAHLDIDLPSSGEIHIVTAVVDRDSGLAGTLAISLNVK